MVVNQSFAFVTRLVLAKLLFPDQFGIIGMASVFTGFVQVVNDVGIGAALVQRKDEKLRSEHFHTAFWTGVVWSIVLYSIVSLIVGPLAARFYNEPILTSLIPTISLGILVSPMNLVHKAQLTKSMNFKRIAFIDNTSNMVSGCIALALAFLGFGVWSLAFNSVASLVIAMPLYFLATGWRPSFVWESEAFKDIFGFGIYTTGTSIVNYVINNIDYLLIGKLVSASALGAYTFAFILTDTFRGKLMAVINNVMYPLYGRKQSDLKSLKNYYLVVVNYNSLIVYPVMLIFIIFGESIIINFFGNKWVDSIEPLKILAVSVMVHMMVNSNTSLIRGMGRPEIEFKLQFFKSLIFVPTLLYGIYNHGIIGAAWAVLLNKVLSVIIAQYTMNKLLKIQISTLEFLLAIKTPWIASLCAAILTYLLFSILNINYVISIIFMLLCYGIVVYILMFDEIKSKLRELNYLKSEKTHVEKNSK